MLLCQAHYSKSLPSEILFSATSCFLAGEKLLESENLQTHCTAETRVWLGQWPVSSLRLHYCHNHWSLEKQGFIIISCKKLINSTLQAGKHYNIFMMSFCSMYGSYGGFPKIKPGFSGQVNRSDTAMGPVRTKVTRALWRQAWKSELPAHTAGF